MECFAASPLTSLLPMGSSSKKVFQIFSFAIWSSIYIYCLPSNFCVDWSVHWMLQSSEQMLVLVSYSKGLVATSNGHWNPFRILAYWHPQSLLPVLQIGLIAYNGFRNSKTWASQKSSIFTYCFVQKKNGYHGRFIQRLKPYEVFSIRNRMQKSIQWFSQ